MIVLLLAIVGDGTTIRPRSSSPCSSCATRCRPRAPGRWRRSKSSPLFGCYRLAAVRAAPAALLFVLALLQAQWTYTGYDASAHVAEETKMARLNSAWGIFLSVAVSAVFGYVMLLVLTWCIPNGDVAATAADPYPVLYIVAKNLTPVADERDRDPDRRRDVALRPRLDHLDGTDVVRLRARRRHAGLRAAQARQRRAPDAGVGDRDHEHPRGARLPLRRGVLRRDVDQHDRALSRLRDPDLAQLPQPAARARRMDDSRRLRRGPSGGSRPTSTESRSSGSCSSPIIFMLPPNQLVFWTMLGLSAFMLIWWFSRSSRVFRGPSQRAT